MHNLVFSVAVGLIYYYKNFDRLSLLYKLLLQTTFNFLYLVIYRAVVIHLTLTMKFLSILFVWVVCLFRLSIVVVIVIVKRYLYK